MFPCVPPLQESSAGESQKYNNCIVHETLRVAVCNMVEEVLDGKYPGACSFFSTFSFPCLS